MRAPDRPRCRVAGGWPTAVSIDAQTTGAPLVHMALLRISLAHISLAHISLASITLARMVSARMIPAGAAGFP